LGLNTDAQENIVKNAIEKKIDFISGWYGCSDVTIFVEAPMHFLMLGVMKLVMLKIGKWLRAVGQNSVFITKVTGKVCKMKSLIIEWIKIVDYPTTEKTGGWVSENFLAMAITGI
jgi:hypothetical protein